MILSAYPPRPLTVFRPCVEHSLYLSAHTPDRHIWLPRTTLCRRDEPSQFDGSGRLSGRQLRSIPQSPQLAPFSSFW